jgi:hypothetical protein
LTGAYSTPTNTSPAAGAAGSRSSTSTSAGSPKALIIAPRVSDFLQSVIAEINKVAPGERATRLLQAAANCEAAEMNWREAKTRDQILHKFDRFYVIPRHENDAAAILL